MGKALLIRSQGVHYSDASKSTHAFIFLHTIYLLICSLFNDDF
jgi:hypothetical protein